MVIYADGAGIKQMHVYAKDERISGFTTNPSLMKQQGISNYRTFAAWVIDTIGNKPVSFEVLGDDFDEMERQALQIAEWGSKVYVKIPITNSRGESTAAVIRRLSREGVNVNVTAVMTAFQAGIAVANMTMPGGIISVFAGRIADAGVDPEPVIMACAVIAKARRQRVLWASTREVFNVVQAERSGADIITLSPELISKLDQRGRDLTAYSLETVRQFHSDGKGIAF
jgi:transaldolase